jgi:hypothetical protein
MNRWDGVYIFAKKHSQRRRIMNQQMQIKEDWSLLSEVYYDGVQVHRCGVSSLHVGRELDDIVVKNPLFMITINNLPPSFVLNTSTLETIHQAQRELHRVTNLR